MPSRSVAGARRFRHQVVGRRPVLARERRRAARRRRARPDRARGRRETGRRRRRPIARRATSAVAPPRSCARRSAPRSSSSRSTSTVRGYDAATSSAVRSVSDLRVHRGAVVEQTPDFLDVGHGPHQRRRASRTCGDSDRRGARAGRRPGRASPNRAAAITRRYAVGVHGVRVGAAFERSLDLAGGSAPDRRKQRVGGRRRLGRHRRRPAAPRTAGDRTSCGES